MKRLLLACLAAVAWAAPACAGPGPCEMFAASIRTAFDADADLDRVYARLAEGPVWRSAGVTVSPARASRAHRVAIAQGRYVADFAAPEIEAGFAPATTRLIALRSPEAPGRIVCRLRLVGETAGRADDMRPADAAAESARRAPMAVLEPLLPVLARARLAAPSVDPVVLFGPSAETQADGSVIFPAGSGRFTIALAPVPDGDGEVFGTLARLVPELGNRGRPLGTFRYTVTTRLAEIRVE